MNDQNSNQNGVTPTEAVTTPTQPVQPEATAAPVQAPEAPKVVEQPTVQVAPATTQTTPAPEATQPAPAAPAEPVQEVAPAPVQPTVEPPAQAVVQPVAYPTPVAQPVQEPVAQPVQEVAQVPQAPVAQPVAEVSQPALVDPAPVPTPVVQQPVQETAPQQPVQQPVQAAVATTQTTPVPEATQPAATEAPATTTATIDGSVVTENSLNSGINSLNAIGAQDVTDVGFVASGEVIKKKTSKGVIIAIIVLVVILLGVLGYFVIYPWVVKNYMSDPKNVYETTIRGVTKNLNSTVDDVLHDKMIYDVSVALDTNIINLSEFSGYTYGANLGVDPNKKLIQYGVYVISPTGGEKSFYNYLKDDSNYLKLSNYESLIYNGKAQMDDESFYLAFQDVLNTYNRTNASDMNYLINKVSQTLIDSIDENKLSKEDASIEVNGSNLKVLANKYAMDEENQKRTIQFIAKALVDDEKSLDILSNLLSEDKALIRNYLEDLSKNDELTANDEEVDSSFDFIIYTYGNKSEIVGYAVESKNNGNLHYYKKDNYSEFVCHYLSTDIETEKEVSKVIKVVGNQAGGSTKYDVSIDDEKLAEITVRSFTNRKIDLDYSVTIKDNGTYTGSIKYDDDRNNTRSKSVLDFSLKINDDRFNVTVNITQDWTSEVANINTKAAVTLTDAEKQNVMSQFMQSFSDTPIGALFQTESGEFDPSIFNFYSQKSIVNPTIKSTVCTNMDVNGNFESLDNTVSCVNGSCILVQNGQTQTFSCDS